MLLYDSKLHLFPGKLKSRWTGSFTIHQVYLNGLVDLLNSKEKKSVQGQWAKAETLCSTTHSRQGGDSPP